MTQVFLIFLGVGGTVIVVLIRALDHARKEVYSTYQQAREDVYDECVEEVSEHIREIVERGFKLGYDYAMTNAWPEMNKAEKRARKKLLAAKMGRR